MMILVAVKIWDCFACAQNDNQILIYVFESSSFRKVNLVSPVPRSSLGTVRIQLTLSIRSNSSPSPNSPSKGEEWKGKEALTLDVMYLSLSHSFDLSFYSSQSPGEGGERSAPRILISRTPGQTLWRELCRGSLIGQKFLGQTPVFYPCLLVITSSTRSSSIKNLSFRGESAWYFIYPSSSPPYQGGKNSGVGLSPQKLTP